MITVTINEKKITFEKPVTILHAAKSAGISIPTLCHHDILTPYGGCRLCLVEVERVPRLQTACSQHISDGMVVWTETKKVVEARRSVLELLLINHPLDCPHCDKAGECELQDLVVKYGPATGRFAEGKRAYPENFEDPLIVRNRERCVLCSRCVRMCDDVQGASALCLSNRGSRTFVEPFSGGRYDCEYCGNCLTVCPVGAITSRVHRHGYRPWLMEREAETVCSYCGVGCSLVLQVRDNSIVRSVPGTDLGFNRGILCGRGRFGYDRPDSGERLASPLVRRNGVLGPATWAEAITHIARRLTEIKADFGSDAIAGIASGRCTNEDAYVFQKFFRGAIGTNNIDSVAGAAYGPAQQFLEGIFGQGITANPLHGISNSDGVLVVGGDPTAVNPVLGLQIRAARKKGAPVFVIGHAGGLKGYATRAFVTDSRGETALLASLISGIRKKKPLPGERPAFEEIVNGLPTVSLEDASEMTGVALDDLVETADTLSKLTNPSLVIGKEIIQTSTGHMNLLFLAVLAYVLNGRIYLLSEFANEQGLLDMGCQPDMLPSGRPLEVEVFRKKCEEALGFAIPQTRGLTYVEMIEAAHAGRIKALLVMGEDTVMNLPGRGYVRDALRNVEFLVVQDGFLTETARCADVVLPGVSWGEREGTFTNLERRIQVTEKAVEGGGLAEWKTISEISRKLGLEMNYGGVMDIFAEIARVSHIFRDLTYEDIKRGNCMWPYKGEPLRHDAHIKGIELPGMFPGTGRRSVANGVQVRGEAHIFHARNASRYSPALESISPEPYVKMSEFLADSLSIEDGERVEVSTEAGRVTVSARRDPGLPENIILMPPFEKGGFLEIARWKVNPAIRVPALDDNRAAIRKREAEASVRKDQGHSPGGG